MVREEAKTDTFKRREFKQKEQQVERLHSRTMTETARRPLHGLTGTLILSDTKYLLVVI